MSIWNRLNKIVLQTAQDLGESVEKNVRQIVDKTNDGLDRWQSDRTSVMGGDSLSGFMQSDNPLIKLESRRLPKHVSMHLIQVFTAAGVFANADQITRFTRELMDNDTNAFQQALRQVFSPEEARQISLWMDTAPGADFAGGWAHRLHHGHDLSAMAELTGEYGLVGTFEWVNHVWLRDFWTPHGVPYLPVGSGTAYEWMVEQGVSPSTAMSLLSVNVAEAASGLLMLSAAKGFYNIHQVRTEIRKYERGLSEAGQLFETGNEYEALNCIHALELSAGSDEHVSKLRLQAAIFCLNNSLHPDTIMATGWGNQAYQIAYELCRDRDNYPETIPYHGNTEISFIGLAATVLAASWSSHVQLKHADYLTIRPNLELGIRKFRERAKKQIKPIIPSLNQSYIYGHRPLSALTNQLMALELSLAIGAVEDTETDPIQLREELMAMLEQVSAEEFFMHEQHLLESVRQNVERLYPLTGDSRR